MSAVDFTAMDPLVPWEGMTEAEATAMLEEHTRRQHAAQDAKRDASFGSRHVLLPPKRQPARMSGPRYFNLMRAIESEPERYADYRPTTLCGGEKTTEDTDLRSAKAKKNRPLLASWGICPACIALVDERWPL